MNVHARLELDWATDLEARTAAGWVAASTYAAGSPGPPPERTDWVVLPCSCTWRSTPYRPEANPSPLPVMRAQYDAHVAPPVLAVADGPSW